jgi:nicotinamide N-methyltransferase
VLELGAGSALPSLIALMNGARSVVITDYPDEPLLTPIRLNIEVNEYPPAIKAKAIVAGHVWGKNTEELLGLGASEPQKYDVIILADLIFNHSYQDQLLITCREVLSSSQDAVIWVTFSHHKPHLAHKVHSYH